MAQLNSDLIINGVNLCESYGFKSVVVKNNDSRIFGAERSINVESKLNGMPTFCTITKSRPKIKIELLKINETNRTPQKITHKDLVSLSRLLFKNDICIIQDKEIIYYGVFTSGQSWVNTANCGYLTLEFEMVSPYCYTPIHVENIRVRGEKSFKVQNISTADEIVYPRIRIIGNNSGNVTIKNNTVNNSVTVTDVKKDEDIVIEGDTKEVYSQTNKKENMLKRYDYTKDYIYLVYGQNSITINGDCDVELSFQCPMLII